MSPFTVVFIVFLVLKLTDVIAWSWWFVTMPLWGVGVFAVACFALAGVLKSVAHVWDAVEAKRRAARMQKALEKEKG
ncbi:MAG: transmembrane Fragile-X-F protein [Gemmatimonadota bacterium]